MQLKEVSEQEKRAFVQKQLATANLIDDNKLATMLTSAVFLEEANEELLRCIACQMPVLHPKRCMECSIYLCK